MEFTSVEKRAIIKVLSDIMLADGVIDFGEKKYLAQIVTVLKVSETDLKKVSSIKVSESIAILSAMDAAKKMALGVMMQQMIAADNDVDENELQIFNVVFLSVGIKIK